MYSTHQPSVVLTDLSFSWPDGSRVLDGITASFGTGRTGLLGDNGTGKTTLIRLMAGDLVPTAGSITVDGHVGYLPQHLALQSDATAADLLGIRHQLDALRSIESGDSDPRLFDVVGDAWDVDARARATLDELGLDRIGLDRAVGTLSGGETVLTALAGLRLRGDEVVLLDEPTNNLDRRARHDLYDAIRTWRGALIVVSHDVTLLDLMDDTAKLRSGSVTTFGGPYSDYREHVRREQAAAEQTLRTAEQKLRTEKRQRVEAQTKLARRRRYARTDLENKRRPKVIMKQRSSQAQVSAGKLRGELDAKVDAARRDVDESSAQVRRDAHIRIDLPDPDVPAGRRLAELRDGRGATTIVKGTERIAVTGRNGIGKTRLLESLVHGSDAAVGGATAYTDRIGYLPQRLDHLNDDLTVLDTVRAGAPDSSPEQLRAQLARFLFRADTVQLRVGDLSGGERFRVAVASLLLAEPAHQLLVLDEPTNNLDLRSIDELVSALDAYRGGLVVVSHDDAFLARLQIDAWLELDAR